jgi:PAS domain-containing protein
VAEHAPQRHLILILARNFAARLATPVWLTDADGSAAYFNEAAEELLGRRFVEGLGWAAAEWSTYFEPRDIEGNVVPFESLPTGVAVREGRPDHADLHIRDAKGVDRRIAVTAFPLFAHPRESVGAIAIFWEMPADEAPP